MPERPAARQLSAVRLTVEDNVIATKKREDWHACLKQQTRCVILTWSGSYEGMNTCKVGVGTTCPRVVAGCKTGEGYDLCGPPIHAEAAAAAQVPEGNQGGIAYLFGHTWLCGDCQHALTAKGISTFVIVGEDA